MKEIKFPVLIKEDKWEAYDIKDIKKFLAESYYLKFNNWFSGKTGIISSKGEYCVYKYDFEKFLDFIGLLHA